jgi:hypothetical protein
VQQSWGFTPLFIATGVLYALANLLTWVFFHPRERAKMAQAIVVTDSLRPQDAIDIIGD